PAGTNSITVVYSGDTNFLSSMSVKNLTTTALSSSPNPSKRGQTVTFTAIVAGTLTGSGIPSGSVTFRDGKTAILGSVTLDTTGKATFTTSALTVGMHAISATYNGDAHFIPSYRVLAQVQMVQQAMTGTMVTSSLNPSVAGQTVTITAAVKVIAP